MSTTVRSIDVGYGNTKYVHARPAAGETTSRVSELHAKSRAERLARYRTARSEG